VEWPLRGTRRGTRRGPRLIHVTNVELKIFVGEIENLWLLLVTVGTSCTGGETSRNVNPRASGVENDTFFGVENHISDGSLLIISNWILSLSTFPFEPGPRLKLQITRQRKSIAILIETTIISSESELPWTPLGECGPFERKTGLWIGI
jgi:hypothetical protein